MLEFLCWEGAFRCTSAGVSLDVYGEIVLVGHEGWLLALGLGALVSGTDDVP